VKLKLARPLGFLAIVVCAQSACGNRATETVSGVQVSKNVCYSTVESKPLLMDIVRIASPTPQPLVICIHGGGWSGGDKQEMLQTALGLAKVGYCVANVEYRLAPKNVFPAAVIDVKTAMNYLRAHASELNINPDRVGVLGSSAGGHLALIMATTTQDTGSMQASSSSKLTPVKVAISLAGPTDLSAPLPENSVRVVENFLGKTRRENPALCRDASPIIYVNKFSPPMLFIHGDKDEVVPCEQSVTMLAACNKAGVPSELITLHGRGHSDGGDEKENEAAIRRMVEFLQKYLKRPGDTGCGANRLVH
jgi:acetyl esterase/lipase